MSGKSSLCSSRRAHSGSNSTHNIRGLPGSNRLSIVLGMDNIVTSRVIPDQNELPTGFTGTLIDQPTSGPLVPTDRRGTATPIPTSPGTCIGISPVILKGKRKANNCASCLLKAAFPTHTADVSSQTDHARPFVIKPSDIITLPAITPEQNHRFKISMFQNIMALYGPDKIFLHGEDVLIYV